MVCYEMVCYKIAENQKTSFVKEDMTVSDKETKNPTAKKGTAQTKTTTKTSAVEAADKKANTATEKGAKATAKPTKDTANKQETTKPAEKRQEKTKFDKEAKKQEAAKPQKEAVKAEAAKPQNQTAREAKTAAENGEAAKKPVKKSADEPKEKPADIAADGTKTKSDKKSQGTTKSVKKSDTEEAQKTAKRTFGQDKQKYADDTSKADGVDGKATKSREKKAKIAADTVENKEKKPSKARGKAEGGTAAISKKNLMKIIIISTAALLAVILTISLVFGLRSCNNDDGLYDVPFANAYKNQTSVGYNAEYLGTVERHIPTAEQVTDEGLISSGTISAYPKFGYTQPYTDAQKTAVIRESSYLCAKPTRNASGTYDKMDAEGRLYLSDGTPVLDKDGQQRKLYKHTASEGLYLGNVSDEEQAVVKRITLRHRSYESYSVTGLYAPAGEVIKIEVSEDELKANRVFTGEVGMLVHIGQALYNRKANNIWTARNVNRMPVILNSMIISEKNATYDPERRVYTAYVGSYLGGPIYIHNTNVTTTVTISGAVNYSHFILGYTTREEFEQNRQSSAPYFDLEVWENGVLHSGPKMMAEKYDYDQIYNAAVLWEKIALVSTQGANDGIVFLYDAFVAAGAAVAFPTQHSVNCPYGWMGGSLNYDAFVNGGAWGNMHEYNHNFQGYGVGAGGEVTNNAMTLVEYSLFTRISGARHIESYGAAGLGGWNNYTVGSWALNEVINKTWGGNGQQGLALYSVLLHNLGQDNFIQTKLTQRRGGYGEAYCGAKGGYYRAWTEVTHNNMSYFFNELLGAGMSDADANKWTDSSYPMFVPVSSVYQTGRSYMYDGQKKYINTMQPFTIPHGADFTVDLGEYTVAGGMYSSGSVVIPDGFTYRIKNVSKPEYGSISNLDLEKKRFTFTPDTDHLTSGKILVTLEITKDDGAFKVDDVDLVLEFKQSYEMNKSVLERTTYSFGENKYTTAAEAYNAGFAGNIDVTGGDNQNPINPNTGKVVQNCNADVWFLDAIQNDANSEADGVVPENVKSQAIVLSGKLYIDDTAKYRFSLRGRMSVALYLSFDGGKTFEQATEFNSTDNAFVEFPTNVEGGYKDYQLQADTWVYFKAVMLRYTGEPRGSFMGLGWGKFTPPAPVVDNDGNIISEIPESVNVAYASALRNSYQFDNSKFETEYFYRREYKYNYTDNNLLSGAQTLVSTNYQKSNSWNIDNFKTEYLTDGNRNTFIHTKDGVGASASKPLVFAIDLGEVKTVNRMIIYTQSRPNGDYHMPKDFNLYGSLDGENYFSVGEFRDVPRNGTTATVNFDEVQLRYYKIEIIGSHCSLIIIGEIEMWHVNELMGGTHLSVDNEQLSFKGPWEVVSAMSEFGHVFKGKKGSTLQFEFEGTQLGLISSTAIGGRYEVYIDGVRVNSIAVKEDSNPYRVSYISEKLNEGKHSVVVKCLDNSANIGSVIFW